MGRSGVRGVGEGADAVGTCVDIRADMLFIHN